ncbi:MAG TPA: hypothetical protein PKM14_09670 [Limnochordia bacterium]|jgi:hypothetical protein|nr:hypothetical protein [Limnochordia bacterium]HPZ80801.1 hypothetical protein [Limnochordia bacterium]
MLKWLTGKFKKKESKVTSLADMAEAAAPVVAIPSWDGASDIYVRLRRVSLMALVQSGNLPNDLLTFATDMALKQQSGKPDSVAEMEVNSFEKYTQLLHAMAREALVEPTYDQIMKEVGWLTDQQLMAIHYYCLGGVRALHSFREATRVAIAHRSDSQDLRGKAQ